MKLISFVLLPLIMLVAAAPAMAELTEIVVKDTAGVVRSVTEVEEPSNIEFTITDASGMPADGAQISIRNEATGTELQAVSANGVVVFDKIEPGTWIVSSVSPDITFTNILVTAGYAAAGMGGAGIGGTLALVAGGGAAIAGTTIAIVEANRNDKESPLSPSD